MTSQLNRIRCALLMIAALLCLPVMAEAALVISATNSVPANNATGVKRIAGRCNADAE